MNDTRSRIAEALRDHQFIVSLCITNRDVDRIADILLSLPGIAIVDVDYLSNLEAAAARDIDRAFTTQNLEFSTGYRAALRYVLAVANSAKADHG